MYDDGYGQQRILTKALLKEKKGYDIEGNGPQKCKSDGYVIRPTNKDKLSNKINSILGYFIYFCQY